MAGRWFSFTPPLTKVLEGGAVWGREAWGSGWAHFPPSAPCLPAPHCPLHPPSCVPVPTPSPSSPCPSSCPRLPPPILLFLPSGPPPFPLRLPCPRGRAQRVVTVNLGSSTWSPRNKASPPAQGLSRGLINLSKTSLVGADLSRAEATLPWRGDLALWPPGPSGHMASPGCGVCGGRRTRKKQGEMKTLGVSAVPSSRVLAAGLRTPGLLPCPPVCVRDHTPLFPTLPSSPNAGLCCPPFRG